MLSLFYGVFEHLIVAATEDNRMIITVNETIETSRVSDICTLGRTGRT
jgi:hypothetical protein